MVKRLTVSAILVTLAMIFSYIENLLPFNFGIPGIKLGLANLVVVIALYLMGGRQAFAVSVLRILLVAFTFGNLAAAMYSIAGGILSFVAMFALYRIKGISVIGVSVIGSVFHNIGQIFVAILAVANISLVFYLPVLLCTGVLTGCLIGFTASLILPRLTRAFSF